MQPHYWLAMLENVMSSVWQFGDVDTGAAQEKHLLLLLLLSLLYVLLLFVRSVFYLFMLYIYCICRSFCNMMVFYKVELLAPRPTPNLEDQ